MSSIIYRFGNGTRYIFDRGITSEDCSTGKKSIPMKHAILFLAVILAASVRAQQEKFIIGAEHVSSFADFWDSSKVVHTRAYWDTAKSLGINFAGLKYFERYSNYGNATVAQIREDIAEANAVGIEVFLTNGFDRYDASGSVYFPERWVYQIENPVANKLNDFTNVSGGTILYDQEASTHWNVVPDSGKQAANFLRLTPGNPPYGIVANHLRLPNLQYDNQYYFLKIKMRLPFAASFDSVPVLRVGLENSSVGRIVYASEFTNHRWKEILVASYFQKNSGRNERVEPPRNDVQIEWFDTSPYKYTVDLDYVAIDDTVAHRLYNGEFDARVKSFVNNYKNAAKSFVVWDEPYPENFLPVQYYRNLVAGLTNKSSFSYRAFTGRADDSTKKFLKETGLPVLVCDTYPIVYGTATPNENGYTSQVQRCFESFAGRLSDLAAVAQKFSKPFWLTVQAHEWSNPTVDPPELYTREPSAYEVRAMTNLAVSFGAKGIIYFMYTNNSDPAKKIYRTGLLADNSSATPEYTDPYGQPKWETIKVLNHTLASIGPALLSLAWQGTKSWNSRGQVYGAWAGLVTAVATNIEGEIFYVETGHLKDGTGANYLYLVNRRTLPTEIRAIKTILNTNGATWTVSDVNSKNSWIVSPNGSFTDTLQPGEGKLYKLGVR